MDPAFNETILRVLDSVRLARRNTIVHRWSNLTDQDHWELAETSSIAAYVAIARDKRFYIPVRLVDAVVDLAWAKTPEAGSELNEFELEAHSVAADAVRHFASSCLEPIMSSVQSVYDATDKEKSPGHSLYALQQVFVYGPPNMDSDVLLPLVRVCWAVSETLVSPFSNPEKKEKLPGLLKMLDDTCRACCQNVGGKINAGLLKIDNGQVVAAR